MFESRRYIGVILMSSVSSDIDGFGEFGELSFEKKIQSMRMTFR